MHIAFVFPPPHMNACTIVLVYLPGEIVWAPVSQTYLVSGLELVFRVAVLMNMGGRLSTVFDAVIGESSSDVPERRKTISAVENLSL
jgi:hypothetical protein